MSKKKSSFRDRIDTILAEGAAPPAEAGAAAPPAAGGDALARLVSPTTETKLDQIEISRIKSRREARESATPEMKALQASISERGILQPVLLRPAGRGYEVVDGEQRLAAARALGLTAVPAVVREMSDAAAEIAAPAARHAPAPRPRVAAKPAPKVAAKAAPKVAAKVAPRVAAKAAPKVAAKVAPRVAAKPAPKKAPARVAAPPKKPVAAPEPVPVFGEEVAPAPSVAPAPIVTPIPVALPEPPAPTTPPPSPAVRPAPSFPAVPQMAAASTAGIESVAHRPAPNRQRAALQEGFYLLLVAVFGFSGANFVLIHDNTLGLQSAIALVVGIAILFTLLLTRRSAR